MSPSRYPACRFTGGHQISFSETLYAVVEVVDGDTIKIMRDGQVERIRLIGIDSPETRDPRKPVQCFGREASARATELLRGQRVRIATDPTQDQRDRYDRLLAYVWLADGTFVNQAMIEEGYAFEYTYNVPYEYQAEFRAAENRARQEARGLWSPDTCSGSAEEPPLAVGGQPAPPSAPGGAQGDAEVVISHIFYDGVVPRVESDEYAEITNRGSAPANLLGWRLNADDPGQDFIFPSFDLQPGQSCRIYTNEIHEDTCGFSFGRGSAIWANDGECGHLYDAGGAEVSEFCY